MPKRETADSFVVEFPKPLDRALLEHELDIADSNGHSIRGTAQIDHEEMRWSFVPENPWKAGRYTLRVGSLLADLAGNMVDRPFEIDALDTSQERAARAKRALPFTVR